MKIELNIEIHEIALWCDYLEKFENCSEIIETHNNGVVLLQAFRQAKNDNYEAISNIVELFKCGKQMNDFSYMSLSHVVQDNCSIIRQNVISKYPPEQIEQWVFKINAKMLTEILAYIYV
jgi:hypothetical protein